ncbi:MAG: hypothetical protein U0L04_12715, partial [Bacteroidaceae bacterium]|nr:hypothetical protein [Bacteroidaceae bacterium]
MAKGNALLGTLRGSTGDVTFRVSNGRQVMSKRARVVRNPKTSKQTYQRMFFATIAKAQSAMKKIVDHSFENVEFGSKSLRYFTSKNIAIMRQNAKFDYNLQTWISPGMSFVPPRTVGATYNKYRVSEGSLSPNNVQKWYKGEDAKYPLDIATAGIYAPAFTDNIGIISTSDKDMQPQRLTNLFDEMLRNEGCRPGDYMTFVFMSAKKNDINAAGAGVFYPTQFHYVRFKVVTFGAGPAGDKDAPLQDALFMLPSNIDGAVYDFPNVLPNTESLVLPSLYETNRDDSGYHTLLEISMVGTFGLIFGENPDKEINYNFEMPLNDEDDQILCGTWIHSRPNGDKLLCSTQDMLLFDPTGDVYDFNLGLLDAYDLWNQGVVAVGDSKYILEG